MVMNKKVCDKTWSSQTTEASYYVEEAITKGKKTHEITGGRCGRKEGRLAGEIGSGSEGRCESCKMHGPRRGKCSGADEEAVMANDGEMTTMTMSVGDDGPLIASPK